MPLKVMTVLGTRPEIIRLSRIIPRLDRLATHILVHTGQNFDPRLSELLFQDLGVRAPDHHVGIAETAAADQIAGIISGCDALFEQEAPDRLLLLGDTNSSLCAIMAKRRGIPVFHMEAGNRCFDDRVPEEVNRRVIDHASDILLPYTDNSRRHLAAEGIPAHRILVTGNPIKEVLDHAMPKIQASTVLADLGLEQAGYLLATLHRAENVDHEARLRVFVASLGRIGRESGLPVIVSTHPRTRSKLDRWQIESDPSVSFLAPFGFFDFVHLEMNARCVLTDSGTVQEECCILGVSAVTLRDSTERPETLECGSNVLSGCDEERIVALVDAAMDGPPAWQPPVEYLATDVSRRVCGIVLSHIKGDPFRVSHEPEKTGQTERMDVDKQARSA